MADAVFPADLSSNSLTLSIAMHSLSLSSARLLSKTSLSSATSSFVAYEIPPRRPGAPPAIIIKSVVDPTDEAISAVIFAAKMVYTSLARSIFLLNLFPIKYVSACDAPTPIAAKHGVSKDTAIPGSMTLYMCAPVISIPAMMASASCRCRKRRSVIDRMNSSDIPDFCSRNSVLVRPKGISTSCSAMYLR